MAKVADVYPGAKFGMLTVIEMLGSKIVSNKVRQFCKCECECGTIIEKRVENLGRANIESCGCAKNTGLTIHGDKTHGLSHSELYSVWQGMKARCFNKNNKAYNDYGNRGITICEEWKNSFIAFYHWAIISGYKKGLTIDRIDNDKSYSPDNCQWITIQEQQASDKKRVSSYYKIIEHNGIRLTMKGWSRRLGGNDALVALRIGNGWDIEKAITTPIDKRKINKRRKK